MKKLDYLDYSASAEHITNMLLFDYSSLIKNTPANKDYRVPSSFYENGYCLLGGITDFRQAHDLLYDFVNIVNLEKTVFSPDAKERMQLAKLDAIPQCHEIVSTGFQALHYDMGQPILEDLPQTMYTIGALYRPLGERNPMAKTRIVSVQKLLSQKSFGSRQEIKDLLVNYTKRYGDGWTEPEPYNSLRLACFARFIDAISQQNKLCENQEDMIGQCFAYDTESAGTNGYQQERDFFACAGLDLQKAEEQIEIKPGQMLVYDNIRTVHGRIGKRQPKELLNFLFGIKQASFEDIDRFREWFISQAS